MAGSKAIRRSMATASVALAAMAVGVGALGPTSAATIAPGREADATARSYPAPGGAGPGQRYGGPRTDIAVPTTGTVQTVINQRPVSLAFQGVSGSGAVSIQHQTGDPTEGAPGGFTVLGSHFRLFTDLRFDRVTICLSYSDADLPHATLTKDRVRLLHFQRGRWVDITTTNHPDQNRVCGVATSFSPFVLAVPGGAWHIPTGFVRRPVS
ncbi:MAG: hypothetical protein NZ518_01185 [Dehalococcoidia bacterium]|nr:hypothetical protein [Dehalococcoidia bacterium]